MGRRYDPDRRQRLIHAAVEIVAERGIAALSHRAVAAAADVPLGSTTYHFTSLDDLLVAALQQANDTWLAELDTWERELPPNASFALELATRIERMAADERGRVRLEYELYVAALRHERLRLVAARSVDRLVEILGRRTADRPRAAALAALLDGVLLQILLTGREPDREQLCGQLSRAMA